MIKALLINTIFVANISLLAFGHDPHLQKQWYLMDRDRGGANVIKTWKHSASKHKVRVAIIEVGSPDITHEDLKNNIYVNHKEIPANGIDDDGNGYIDDYYGYNVQKRRGFSTIAESIATSSDHATHTAGIIGAVHNHKGIAGIIPHVEILNIYTGYSLFAPHTKWSNDMAHALNYALDNGAQVINISSAVHVETKKLKQAFHRAQKNHVMIVIAAGNEASNSGSLPSDYTSQFTNVISVASSTQYMTLAPYSNYGVNTVDIAAPGEHIYSTIMGNQYSHLSGTSMSAPVVTGIVGLVLSIDGRKAAKNIKQRILDSSYKFDYLGDVLRSKGIINAYGAITK